ncbi:exodeoxyribonuclease VII small subunit [Neopusillimonas maritima]|jgi:exodeoxyribonuclease VII small subunit|uniref:Exodeoxyribonuclease 7 small subunit n=1 Tax=Neopusillimonas maritima TaxID=2026239 RepID=A0ABX9MX62_9BURK|nr:exodeoxyribonuclease VII small subunit [Neopusillimonas maritima]RII82684.1 exodeoxyribonuclease VII small subunit [Neopusillimonas maritima]
MAEKQKTSSDLKSKDTAPLPDDFETALMQLETLVAKMEDGDMPLEQSLAAYERGVALAKRCQSLLDAAEQQVKVLQGNLLKPLDADATPDESQL